VLAALSVALGALPARAGAAPAPVQPPPQNYDPKRWAIIIGVNNYTRSAALPALSGPGNDARNLTEALIDKGRFDPSHVVVLAEGTESGPTSDNILAALSRVVREMEEDSLLLLFFAGHGIAPQNEAYLLPADVIDVDEPGRFTFQHSALAVADVRKFIEGSKARHVILFLDACRNDPNQPRGRGRGFKSMELDRAAAMQKAFEWQPGADSRVREVVTLFSSHPGQESFETGGKQSTGYFTNALVRALRGEVPEARRHDGAVTITSLIGFVTKEVPAQVARDMPGKTQNPYVYFGGGEDIALTFPGKVPTSTPAHAPGPTGAGPVADPTPERPVSLRLRLPPAALTRAGLVVTRNHFSVDVPALRDPLTVRPGAQFVQVKLPGYEDWSRHLEVRDGTVDVGVTLKPRRTQLLLGLGVAAVGGAAMATGVYLGAQARAVGREVTAQAAPSCPTPSPCVSWDGSLVQKDARGRRLDTWSKVLMLGGGAVTLAGLGWAAFRLYSASPLEPEGTDVALAPLPGGAEVAVGRRW
jgi:hypothetical protein